MNFRRYFAIIAATLAISSPAAAGDLRQGAKAVIELFTSQGCSSCPKADAMFDALAKRRDVVALAYHVDYWDYIGWADTFGAKANSDLQRDYADSWGSSRIFTPQLVVNGAGSVVGSREDEVKTALASATLPLEVGLTTSDDMLDVAIAPRAGLNDAVVWLVTFIDRADVAIERGENEGKEVDLLADRHGTAGAGDVGAGYRRAPQAPAVRSAHRQVQRRGHPRSGRT